MVCGRLTGSVELRQPPHMRPNPPEVRDHPACQPVAHLCSCTLSRAEHATEAGLHVPLASTAGLCCRRIEMGEAHRSRG